MGRTTFALLVATFVTVLGLLFPESATAQQDTKEGIAVWHSPQDGPISRYLPIIKEVALAHDIDVIERNLEHPREMEIFELYLKKQPAPSPYMPGRQKSSYGWLGFSRTLTTGAGASERVSYGSIELWDRNPLDPKEGEKLRRFVERLLRYPVRPSVTIVDMSALEKQALNPPPTEIMQGSEIQGHISVGGQLSSQ